MNKQDIITSIASLEAQISELYIKESEVEQKCDELVKSFWFPHLCDYRVIEKGFFLDCSRTYFAIKRFREGKAFSDTMITISVTENYLRATDEQTIRGIETSFYTTSENSAFELERMVVIGRIGQLLLDRSEELTAGLNELFRARKAELAVYYKQRWELEKQLKEFRKLKEVLDRENLLEVLKAGVTFTEEEGRSYPRLTFRFNSEDPIKYLKVTNVKGQSANIEYISKWGGGVNKDVIRYKHIEKFISYYRDRIVACTEELVS